MSTPLAVALALAPIVILNLHILWLLVRRPDGIAIASFVAAWLMLAIGTKALKPSLPVTAVWLPLLYPYALLGLAAVLLLLVRLRRPVGLALSRFFSPPAHDGLHSLLVAAVLGHIALGLLSFYSRGTMTAYLFAPPLLSLCVLTYSYLIRLCQYRRAHRPLGLLPVLLLTCGVPLGIIGMAQLHA